MPQIMPIKDLRNTNKMSELCQNTNEPIFITKNGYGDMVVMSIKTYEQKLAVADVYQKLAQAESDVEQNKVTKARDAFARLDEKYADR